MIKGNDIISKKYGGCKNDEKKFIIASGWNVENICQKETGQVSCLCIYNGI